MRLRLLLLATLFLSCLELQAQFDFNGQLMQRTELRNGYGSLIPQDTAPAAFIGSRARLQFSYKLKSFNFYTSIQDIRIFGNTPQAKVSDGNLSVYETWGEVSLDSAWSIKVGRQELNYDNIRFLGSLDWALQGRTHDFVLVKYEKNKLKIHAGGGFNQDSDRLYGNLFLNTNQYKTAQMIRAEYSAEKWTSSFLFWNDGRQYIQKDSTGKITEKGVRFMQTIGLPTLKFTLNNTTISGFYYHQLGKDVKNKDVNAFDVSIQGSQLLKFNEEKGSQLRITAGTEILSGTPKTETTKNNSFSPLYGTNHAHNGYMDYFYLGGRHEGSVGLQDIFLRLKYDFSKKFFLSANTHYFSAAADVYDALNAKQSKYLGTEIDLTFGYIFKDNLSLQVGYSQMLASSSLKALRGNASVKDTQNWAYIMLIFRPKSNKPFVGLTF